jgi:hypothetical protein
MKNAHLRMGSLQFTKMLRDTTIDITLCMDRMIAEHDADNRSARCHLLSVIGNDQEVAAIAAAIADEARFYASGPDVRRLMITLGKEAEVFRSSISIPGRRRPLRHLVAISEELSKTRAGGNPTARRTILCDDDRAFLLYRIGARFGLPVLPECRWRRKRVPKWRRSGALPGEPFGVSLSLFSEVLLRTARSRQGRAVVGRGEANP